MKGLIIQCAACNSPGTEATCMELFKERAEDEVVIADILAPEEDVHPDPSDASDFVSHGLKIERRASYQAHRAIGCLLTEAQIDENITAIKKELLSTD